MGNAHAPFCLPPQVMCAGDEATAKRHLLWNPLWSSSSTWLLWGVLPGRNWLEQIRRFLQFLPTHPPIAAPAKGLSRQFFAPAAIRFFSLTPQRYRNVRMAPTARATREEGLPSKGRRAGPAKPVLSRGFCWSPDVLLIPLWLRCILRAPRGPLIVSLWELPSWADAEPSRGTGLCLSKPYVYTPHICPNPR